MMAAGADAACNLYKSRLMLTSPAVGIHAAA
jgi:hypothetical protein